MQGRERSGGEGRFDGEGARVERGRTDEGEGRTRRWEERRQGGREAHTNLAGACSELRFVFRAEALDKAEQFGVFVARGAEGLRELLVSSNQIPHLTKN